jgi:hypothetical protein
VTKPTRKQIEAAADQRNPMLHEPAILTNRRGDKTKPPAWGIVCDGDCGMFVPDNDETKEEAAVR